MTHAILFNSFQKDWELKTFEMSSWFLSPFIQSSLNWENLWFPAIGYALSIAYRSDSIGPWDSSRCAYDEGVDLHPSWRLLMCLVGQKKTGRSPELLPLSILLLHPLSSSFLARSAVALGVLYGRLLMYFHLNKYKSRNMSEVIIITECLMSQEFAGGIWLW